MSLARCDAARKLGAVTIGISCTPNSELARAVDIAITPLPGPEVITGSTRLKAGTATKLVLNMLTTGSMIRRGYVYGNLMVNVQPTNAKLLDRARRIVRDAAGISDERGWPHYLEAAGNVVKEAIAMALDEKGTSQVNMDKFVIEGGRGSTAPSRLTDRRTPRCRRWPRCC